MVHFLSRRFRHRDSGAVAVFTVIILSVVFVALCALVIDLGLARDTRRQAQNAADASALAAGNALYLTGLPAKVTEASTGAIAVAKSYALKNYGVTESDWASCTDSAKLNYHPSTACISFDSETAPSAIRVSIPVRQVATPFAGIWGVSSVPVNAAAQIQLTGGRAVCGLCVLGPGEHNLQVGKIVATNADVMFNGTLTANSTGSINVTGGNIYLQGPAPGAGAGTYSPAPIVNQPAVADPLANLSMPDYTGLVAKTNSCTDGPGIYSHLQGATPPCTMLPGLYVVTGPLTSSERISGSNSITALGVTMYFTCGTPAVPRTCNPGEKGGELDFTGGGTLTITAPTTGPTAGLAIVADRNNTGTFSYKGNGTVANTGTIYTLNGTLNYQGNSGALVMDSLVVAGKVSFTGAVSDFRTSYTQANNVVIPFSVLNLSQ
jgi:Flp pilus assembly protein TadG